MHCINQTAYRVQQGDDLYSIGQRFGMTVQEIYELNPWVDPANLPVDSTILICKREDRSEREGQQETICDNPSDLSKEAHNLWTEQAFWMNQFIETIDDPQSSEMVQERLLNNAQRIADFYMKCYDGNELTIENLIRTYFTIGLAYVLATMRGDSLAMDQLLQRWYQTAGQIAIQLAQANPYYDYNMLLKMWYEHVSTAQHQILLRVQENYLGDETNMKRFQEQTLNLADYIRMVS